MPTPTALVRRPSSCLGAGIVTHIERTPVDFGLAMSQWERYVTVVSDHGWETIEVPPAEACPDSVFVEDTMVVLGDVAVIANSAAGSRQPETEAAEQVVGDLGYSIERIRPPGTLDGGDVLKVDIPDRGPLVYVGRGGRTNSEGIRQLRSILEPLGATVIEVPISKVLHLKSAVTALPDSTIIGYPPAVDDPAVFPRFLAVPEESGAHVVLLGGDRLLMASDAPQTAAMLTGRGFTPVLVDIGEFVKLEGCVTCLSVRLRGLNG